MFGDKGLIFKRDGRWWRWQWWWRDDDDDDDDDDDCCCCHFSLQNLPSGVVWGFPNRCGYYQLTKLPSKSNRCWPVSCIDNLARIAWPDPLVASAPLDSCRRKSNNRSQLSCVKKKCSISSAAREHWPVGRFIYSEAYCTVWLRLRSLSALQNESSLVVKLTNGQPDKSWNMETSLYIQRCYEDISMHIYVHYLYVNMLYGSPT